MILFKAAEICAGVQAQAWYAECQDWVPCFAKSGVDCHSQVSAEFQEPGLKLFSFQTPVPANLVNRDV